MLLPRYSYVAVIFAFLFNTVVYTGARAIAGGWTHHNIESSIDRMIPFFAPSAAIYLGCYLFWAVNYILIARQGKEEVCRFFAGDFLSRVICLIFYLVFPTTNIRPEVVPDGFWNQVMLWVYSVDAADNLFPSIHCLVSWFCYIGIRDGGSSGVVPEIFLCDGSAGMCLDADDEAACDRGCGGRDFAGGNLSESGKTSGGVRRLPESSGRSQ